MRDLLDFREHDVGRRRLVLVFVGPRMSAAIPGEAEVLADLLDAVHLARRDVVAHAVNLVVVAPERLVLRVEVHAFRIAQAGRVDFAVRAILVHADDPAHADLLVEFDLVLRRHVVGLAELDIELVVRPHAAFARAVIEALLRLRNQLTLRNNDADADVRALIEELRRRILQNAVLLDHVEESVLREARAVRHLLRQVGANSLTSTPPSAPARERSVTAQILFLRVPTKVTTPCGPTAIWRASGTSA